MYLQITTKCNFHCGHCAFSCNMKGKHAEYNTVIDMIAYARDNGEESITLGGGEPTLHPRFFDILEYSLRNFENVFFVTNGSQTEKMFRIANIIDDCDFESSCFKCTCDKETLEHDGCQCDHPYIYADGKLSVDLSLDPFHNPIDNRIKDLWKKRSSQHTRSNFHIRDTSDHISGQGRAKKNGYDFTHCICSNIILKPDGKIRLCGCTRSPVIGDIWEGIDQKWQDVIYENEGYQNSNCYRDIEK